MSDAEKEGQAAGLLGLPGNTNCPFVRWSAEYFDWWRGFLRTGAKP